MGATTTSARSLPCQVPFLFLLRVLSCCPVTRPCRDSAAHLEEEFGLLEQLVPHLLPSPLRTYRTVADPVHREDDVTLSDCVRRESDHASPIPFDHSAAVMNHGHLQPRKIAIDPHAKPLMGPSGKVRRPVPVRLDVGVLLHVLDVILAWRGSDE